MILRKNGFSKYLLPSRELKSESLEELLYVTV